MKMVEMKTPIYGDTQGEVKQFGMVQSSKAYTILSSGLYKFKIRAFIRELSCNAIDGHIALALQGKPVHKQFDVELPSELSLQWRLRDYGIGLSPEGIDALFTTYFASTKEESDDFIGAFGLGSKSPFCYTTTFTVTSWFDGVKTVYSIYMNNGIPACVPVHSCPSDEHTGIEIVVPVDQEDISDIQEESRFVYYTFNRNEYFPNFVGTDLGLCTYKDEQKNIPRLYDHGTYAIMGGVSYSIPRKFIDGTVCEIYFPKNSTKFIEFPMGSLNPLPNREELSLDEHTITTLKKYFKSRADKVWDDVTIAIAGCKDAREKINKIKDLTFGTSIFNFVSNTIYHNKKTLKEWDVFYYNIEFDHSVMKYLKYIEDNLKDRSISHMNGFSNTSYKIFDRTRSSRYYSNYKVKLDSKFDPKYHTTKYNIPLLIVDNSVKGYKKNIRSLQEHGIIPKNSHGVMMFNQSGMRWNKKHDKMIRDVLISIAKRYHKDDVCVYDVEKLWGIHGPVIQEKRELASKEARKNAPRSNRVRDTGHSVVVFYSDKTNHENIYAKDVDSFDGFYVIVKGGCYYDDDDTKFDQLIENSSLCRMADWLGKPVYRIPSALKKRAEKNPNLSRLVYNDIKETTYKNAFHKLTSDTVGFNVHRRLVDNILLSDPIRKRYDLVSKKSWDEDTYRDYMNLLSVCSYNENEELKKYIASFEDAAVEKYKTNLEIFKKEHLVVYTLLHSVKDFSISDEVWESINKMVTGA